MPEKKSAESVTSVNILPPQDHTLLRDYSELLNRRIMLAVKVQKQRSITHKIDGAEPNHDVNLQSARDAISWLLKEDSAMEQQEQKLIDQMTEEGRSEARATKAAVAPYLAQLEDGEVI